jgi:hypothetical protein
MSDERETTRRIQVWRQPDGMWRWRYRDPTLGADLVSAEVYESEEAAARAARWAYPGVPIDRVSAAGLPNRMNRLLVRSAAVLAFIAIIRRPLKLFRRIRTLRRWLGFGGSRPRS